MNDRHLDDEFARIVAGWDAEAPDPQAGLPGERPRPSAPASDASSETSTRTPEPVADGTIRDAAAPDTRTSGERVGSPTDDAPPPAPTTRATPSTTPSTAPEDDAPAGLGLPIASTTAHVWRGGTPRRDDTDDLLAGVDPDDPEDHFQPPSDIDLPSAETDPMFWAIVGGLVGGPLLLLYVLFFDRDGSAWWVVTALAMVVVGFVLLVLRGGTERDPSDDGTRV